MPPRRPGDVVRVLMTDHLIQRPTSTHERLAEHAERDPVLSDVRPYGPGLELPGNLREIYRLLPLATSYGHAGASARLAKLLPDLFADQPEARLALAETQIRARQFGDAERTLAALPIWPTQGNLQRQAEEWRALVEARQGRSSAAIQRLRALARRAPLGPEAAFNLGLLLGAQPDAGRRAEAIRWLQRALDQRPNFVMAWFHLGQVHARDGRGALAEQAWRRALALEPGHERSETALARRLLDTGRADEASQRLAVSVPLSARPERLVALQREAEAAAARPQPTRQR
jgi:predicted Zn-dependent protease